MRIITGRARGVRLKAPKGLSTRPTSDRVKESLFNILGARVQNRRVLDLFAGTGSLGLEALSRGAARAVMVDRATGNILQDNAEHAKLSELARIMRGDVFTALTRLAADGETFDLVFCDPPYGKGLWERALTALDGSSLLSEGALVIALTIGNSGFTFTYDRVGNRAVAEYPAGSQLEPEFFWVE